jgi:hypothetical protein
MAQTGKNKTRMKKILPLLFMLIGVIIVGVAAFVFLRTSTSTSAPTAFPESIIGIPLTDHLIGDEAIASIAELHGKTIPLADGVVAVYGDQTLTLWVSAAENESAAADLTQLMVTRIAEGRSPFTDKGILSFEGVDVYYLEGLGQKHFYWQSKNLVLWIAVDEEYAGDALTEVIQFYR